VRLDSGGAPVWEGAGWCWAVGELCGTAREALDWATRAREGRCSGAGARIGCRRVPRLAMACASRPSVCGLYRQARQRDFGNAAVWASSLGMRARTLAGVPGRRTGDGPLVQGITCTGGAEHDAFPAFKASGGEP
jgi:hypothetical protein